MTSQTALPLIFRYMRDSGGRPANTVFAICCLLVLVLFIIFLFRKEYLSKEWNKGEIPKDFKPTKENIFEIYVAAACAIMLRDPKRLRGKFGILSKSLLSSFPDQHYNFSESFEFSLGTPLKIDSLSKWCNQYFSRDQKVHLLNFLAEIALSDNYAEEQEKQHLYLLAGKLKLSITDLRKELFRDIYESKDRSESGTYSSGSKSKYFKTLGLNDSASEQEVKNAYRALVKITHPDRFMNEPLEVQERMKNEFREIQEAYEKITEN